MECRRLQLLSSTLNLEGKNKLLLCFPWTVPTGKGHITSVPQVGFFKYIILQLFYIDWCIHFLVFHINLSLLCHGCATSSTSRPPKMGDAPCHRCGHGLRSVRGGWRRCRRHLDLWRRRERRKRCADLSRNMTLWQTLTCKWISLWICKDADWQSLWNHCVWYSVFQGLPQLLFLV